MVTYYFLLTFSSILSKSGQKNFPNRFIAVFIVLFNAKLFQFGRFAVYIMPIVSST